MKIEPMKVEYVDHMGSDLSVVNAARVSFAKASEWSHVCWSCDFSSMDWHDDVCPQCGTDNYGRRPGDGMELAERDVKLIRYLAEHNHWSPFAHTSIQLRVKAPIFVARQLVKHQVGGVWNEVSRRYVDDEPSFYFPDVWRGRPDGSMKQGSSEIDAFAKLGYVPDYIKQSVESALAAYEIALEDGVAPEQARMLLPQNMHTEWYWTGSLMFFHRVCKLRLDPHAQAETREVAQQIRDIVLPIFPVSWSSLTP